MAATRSSIDGGRPAGAVAACPAPRRPCDGIRGSGLGLRDPNPESPAANPESRPSRASGRPELVEGRIPNPDEVCAPVTARHRAAATVKEEARNIRVALAECAAILQETHHDRY